MAHKAGKHRRYTSKGDKRGSASNPHPNSLAARDPSLLRRIKEDFHELAQQDYEWQRESRYREKPKQHPTKD